ncbi:Prephenate and/or arogenate dehydrogenase (unknown specificity) [Winogradskyella psychrotolerans RS-3]|uniref:Prephenate/arogenate dehydrogenase domain-containing protein n=1 Tax=Winogradskyella psychrotolerans RS-3 TaxID=641526 RepID=S7X9F6_9FLAO|nr:prephenate dehydrogenase [Winogradskyella psychrotolerans]EPR72663.1 Prephenate and/or arogenate dehydrogenase (unknown specificity) [Winogradskyella psychrotolerans RS-3]
MNNIFIIGVGLIGGSFALDIKALHPECKVFGIDTTEAHLEEALQLGVIDEKANFEDLNKADIVIIAIPVDATLDVLPKVLNHISDDAIVFDAGSTKEDICDKVRNHPKRRNYLAVHPIAGTEHSGPKAAIHGLYKYKTNIICEVEETAFKLQEKALKLFSDLGMRIRYMNPKAHDKHIAYVSHLSHISAFMLGKTVIDKERNERDIFDMAGSGFASTVRLAKSSPAMWTPIFKQNKANVIETLDEYIDNLKHFKQLMEDNDFEAVYNEMEKTNHIKDILNGIQ